MKIRPPDPDTRPCPWPTCPKRTKPRYLMCREHWYALPADIRDRITAAYRPGQNALTASLDYRAAYHDALAYARSHSPRPITGLSGETLTIEHDEDGVAIRADFRRVKLSVTGARAAAAAILERAALAEAWMRQAASTDEWTDDPDPADPADPADSGPAWPELRAQTAAWIEHERAAGNDPADPPEATP